MSRVVWTEPARQDLENIRAYIGQFSPLAAQRMALRLRAAADGLRDYPERGRSIPGGRRELTIINPYLIRYRCDGEIVVILRICHGVRIEGGQLYGQPVPANFARPDPCWGRPAISVPIVFGP